MAEAARKLAPVDDNDNKADKDKETTTPTSDDAKAVEAARGEVIEASDNQKTVTWEGITLVLPKEMPAVAILDRAEMESSEDSGAIIRLLRTLLGGDQFMTVRNKVVEVSKPDMSDQIEHIGNLIEVVLNSYGTEQGESEGSAS